jgi:heparosan-N-sulfate-glucuronate 5-epimerase
MKKESRIPEGLSVQGPLLGHYYHDFRYELFIPRNMDYNGIPLWDYGAPIGHRYHPVLITAYSLALHEKYLYEDDDESRTRFLYFSDFLVDMQKKSRTGFGWEYDIPNYKFYVIPPWISAMSQGLGISALLRAYQIEPKPDYLESATKAMQAFKLSCRAGGVRDIDANGHVYFEETPSTAPDYPKHILNGFFFALWGIFDYYRVTDSESAKTLFYEGVETLRSMLGCYDTGYWTLYCLGYQNYLADRFYHQVHIDAVNILYTITKDSIFAQSAKRWSAYQTNWASLSRWWITYKYSRISQKINRLLTFLKLL